MRTVPIVLLVVLQIIVTPILAAHAIPYFLDGQRLVVGLAMDQLRPAGLAGGRGWRAGHVVFGGRGVLEIPPMPTWAMISVIVGWIVGCSVIGAWRMMTRRVISIWSARGGWPGMRQVKQLVPGRWPGTSL